MSNKNRTLVIDAQLFQSYTFHRGMGKYSLSLLKELNSKLPSYENKILVFNNISGYLSDDEMSLIKDATPGFSYEFLNLKHVDNPDDYAKIRDGNRSVIDAYIESRLPDHKIDFLILSLFQETEVAVFPTVCDNKYLLIYDLIPIQFFNPYLLVEAVAKNYLKRFDTLVEADHFFTISQSVASELALLIGVPKARITPIYGAPVKRRHLEGEAIDALRNTKFILLPSGDDYRKNNEFAIRSFELFRENGNHDYKIVVTSSFTDVTRAHLSKFSDNVLFLGNVSEAQLAWLYEKAKSIFFPSQSEGLGLPILEAIEFGKSIACSDIPVFKEISEDALIFCDPYNVDDMARALGESVRAKTSKMLASYRKVLEKYTWESSANILSKVVQELVAEDRPTIRKKVAIFSPKPDGFSGIGKVVQEQHYVFSRKADVTYYFEHGVSVEAQGTEIRKNYLKYAATMGDPWSFGREEFERYDKVIYHIGNGEYHVVTLVRALAFPCHVVLHDTRIKGLFGVTRNAGLLTQERFEAEDTLNDILKPTNGEFLASLINKQSRVTVHSNYAKKAVEEVVITGFNEPIIDYRNLGIPETYHVDQPTHKGFIYVAMAGLMTGSKGIDMASSITKIKLNESILKVKIFGFSMLDEETKRVLQCNENIELIPSPTDTRYLFELSQSNIILNFRHPYHGETSYSTLEGLRFAKDVIVNNNGWFGELPNDLVYKAGAVSEVLGLIKDIADKAIDNNLRKARIDYITRYHSVVSYIDELLK